MPDLLFQSKQEKLSDGSPVVIVRILGAIDGTTASKFEEKLLGFFNQGVKSLILVFTDVKYINSSGLGLLLKFSDKFHVVGGNMKLVGIPKEIIAFLEMYELRSLFEIYDTEEEAIQSFFSPKSKQEKLPDSPPVIVHRVLGSIDEKNIRELENKLIGFFNQQSKNVILDFTDTKSINSTGMGLIVKLADKFQEAGGDIKLVGVPEKVIALFDMLGLMSLFKVYETEEEAMQSFISASLAPDYSPPSAPPPPMSVQPFPMREQPSSNTDFGLGGIAISDFSGGMAISGMEDFSSKIAISDPEKTEEESRKKSKKKKKEKQRKESLPYSVEMDSWGDLEPTKSADWAGQPLNILDLDEAYQQEKERISESTIEPYEPVEQEKSPKIELAKVAIEDKSTLKGGKEIAVKEQQLPKFEKWLSEDAGNPKVFERFIAQSKIAMRLLQKTIGLYCVVIINLLDNISDLVTGYINGVYQAWKTYRTIEKRLKMNTAQAQTDKILKDVTVAKETLSRLFYFPGFKRKDNIVIPTFALELILEIRGHLDQMKRDLSVINAKEAKKTATKTVVDFIKSFIPNPLELIPIFKDFFILAFVMKYSRSEIEQMYVDLLVSYENIILSLAKGNNTSVEINWQHYEKQMYTTSTNNYIAKDKENLDSCIAECRHKIQRLIQMLCNPKHYLEPRHWSIHDLCVQVQKEQLLFCGQTIFSMELERRLREKIRKSKKYNNAFGHPKEKKLQAEEQKKEKICYEFQKKLYEQFL